MKILLYTGGFDTCTCVLVQVYGGGKARRLLNHRVAFIMNNTKRKSCYT